MTTEGVELDAGAVQAAIMAYEEGVMWDKSPSDRLRYSLAAYERTLSADRSGAVRVSDLREELAAHLCDEFDEDFQPRRNARWPEDANDDGKREGGYVAIQPAHVRARALEAADRILGFVLRRISSAIAAPPASESVTVASGVREGLRKAVALKLCEFIGYSFDGLMDGKLPEQYRPVHHGVTGWKYQGHKEDVLEFADSILALSASPVTDGVREALTPVMAAFGASEYAGYKYPGEDQQRERAAFCEGAAFVVASPTASQPASEGKPDLELIEATARKINPGRSEDHIKSVALDALSIIRALSASHAVKER
jgi:hypothetical protein